MAKLVDATDSKSVDRKVMLVQVRLEVPKISPSFRRVFFISVIIKQRITVALRDIKKKRIH